MVYARITRVRPSASSRRAAMETLRELMALYMEDPRCVFQGTSNADGNGEVVKVSLWETREAANTAAAQPKSLALRSQLMLLCERPSLEEAHELSGASRRQALAALARTA